MSWRPVRKAMRFGPIWPCCEGLQNTSPSTPSHCGGRSRKGCWQLAATLRSTIVLLIGLPGSGKSTWVAKQKAVALSSDAVRELLADDPTDQSIHARVFA